MDACRPLFYSKDGPAIVAAFAVVAVAVARVLVRSGAFWCGARGLPLGTFLRRPGFSYERLRGTRLDGKVVLVTGANSGLGLEVATQCARAGATVVLACRDASKAEAAASAIASRAGVPRSRLRVMRVDLCDLKQMTQAAAALVGELDSLHVLINNAGVATHFPYELTADGVEHTFQANFLGHFHLTACLLPLLERTARATGERARVVHLSSGAHRAAPAEGVPLSLEGVNDRAIGPVARRSQ